MPTDKTTRIGIDLGGTKIAGIALDCEDRVRDTARCDTPVDDYRATLTAISDMVAALLTEGNVAADQATVGIGIPGSCAPKTGRIQNANSTWLNGRPFKDDLEATLGRPIRLANDANCFALSEALDGNAADARNVFGVILGTGCGGGIVIDGKLVDGPLGISGEWGHTALPSPTPQETPGPLCWCGRNGCMETWVSGPAVAADHLRVTGETLNAESIAERSNSGDPAALATLERLADRLARGLSMVTNILDPDVIVLGGGLSSVTSLYEMVPDRMTPHIFADHVALDIRPPKWGPESGVRGAARLWG